MTLAQLKKTAARYQELRLQRNELIRTTPGTLRQLAEATGLSHEAIRQIKQRSEK